jgi:hypothetical protein
MERDNVQTLLVQHKSEHEREVVIPSLTLSSPCRLPGIPLCYPSHLLRHARNGTS